MMMSHAEAIMVRMILIKTSQAPDADHAEWRNRYELRALDGNLVVQDCPEHGHYFDREWAKKLVDYL